MKLSSKKLLLLYLFGLLLFCLQLYLTRNVEVIIYDKFGTSHLIQKTYLSTILSTSTLLYLIINLLLFVSYLLHVFILIVLAYNYKTSRLILFCSISYLVIVSYFLIRFVLAILLANSISNLTL